MHPRRQRDRHGRGLRGRLAPPDSPLSRTRAEQFDALVLDSVDALAPRWRTELRDVEFAIEEVPAPEPVSELEAGQVPLGRALRATYGHRAPGSGRIVIYRRPIEARAAAGVERAELVHAVVVEQVATLLGLEPQTVDPDYETEDDP